MLKIGQLIVMLTNNSFLSSCENSNQKVKLSLNKVFTLSLDALKSPLICVLVFQLLPLTNRHIQSHPYLDYSSSLACTHVSELYYDDYH